MRTGESLNIPGLSRYRLIGFVFYEHEELHIVQAKPSQKLVATEGGKDSHSKYHNMYAEFTITGDTITFVSIGYNQIQTGALGASVTRTAGDSYSITQIWGIT